MTDNQYYSEEYPSVQLQYSIPDPDYYGPQPRRSHKQSRNPAGYYPPPPDPADVQHWHAHVEEENVHFCMDIDSSERRPTQQKVERQGKDVKFSNNVLES